MRRRLLFALLLMAGLMPAGFANAAPDLTQLAQAQPAQAPAAAPQTPAAPAPATQTPATPAPDPAAPVADAAPEEPIGSVATVTGKATVTRDDKTIPLKVKDDIYLNDVVQTAASSSLGLTFSDGTTFNLKANAQITIDTFVYEDGGKQNAGVFDVAKGTVAFVAAAVAKTGDMKITTPTATLGIRGTSGLVEVPAGASAATTNNVNVKALSGRRRPRRPHRGQRSRRRAARLSDAGLERLCDPARLRRRALCRGADHYHAADDRARHGISCGRCIRCNWSAAACSTSSAPSAAPIRAL